MASRAARDANPHQPTSQDEKATGGIPRRARKPHRWTDEDAAYAAAQWASGIPQRDIGVVFGLSYRSAASTISLRVRDFLSTYAVPDYGFTIDQYYGDDRKELVRQALAVFVAQRGLNHVQRVLDGLMKEGREMGLHEDPDPNAPCVTDRTDPDLS